MKAGKGVQMTRRGGQQRHGSSRRTRQPRAAAAPLALFTRSSALSPLSLLDEYEDVWVVSVEELECGLGAAARGAVAVGGARRGGAACRRAGAGGHGEGQHGRTRCGARRCQRRWIAARPWRRACKQPAPQPTRAPADAHHQTSRQNRWQRRHQSGSGAQAWALPAPRRRGRPGRFRRRWRPPAVSARGRA